MSKSHQSNTERLCSVYCPDCAKVTQKISFNLLREARTVHVTCSECLNITVMNYNGTVAEVTCLLPIPRAPEAFKTEALCLAAVRHDGGALEDVPEAFKTAEVCLAAVRQQGCALEYVPEALMTMEICLAAVQQEDCVLMYVPKELQEQVRKEAEVQGQ